MNRNRGHSYETRIAGEGAGRELLDYLAARFSHSSRAAWARRIDEGRVLLDGRRTSPHEPLRAGARLVWRRPPWVEPAAPLGFAVLHEDAQLLAVAKPAGLPTLAGGGFLEHTLLSLLDRHVPGAKPLHRLGRHTSGVVLCSRTPRAHAALSAAWTARRVFKSYRALAVGEPRQDRFEIDVPIGPVPYAPLGTLHAACPRGGRSAHSAVRVLERRGGTFLCDVVISTGRPHQIRVHLAAAGHPLAGDPLYGPGGIPRRGTRALPGDGGYRLHAAELRFPHPQTERPTCVRCAPPPELRETLLR